MSYRNQYTGSPWQHGGPPFGLSNYTPSYGAFNDQYPPMNAGGYGRSQLGFGGMYGGMGQRRNMGYRGPPSPRYGNERMRGNRNVPRGHMQRKRLPLRSPVSEPRSKRPNLSGGDRRPSRPQRNRDATGGSKKSGRDHSDDDVDTYNPAEPTDDQSDYDGYESYKCSSDDEAAPKENGEQTEKPEEEEDKNCSEKAKKLVCYVCKVTCASEHKLEKHKASEKHTSKISELLAIRKTKKESGESDGKRKSSRESGNWCTVCECIFQGNFLAHRRTKEHRKKRDRKYPKCRPCRMGFTSIEEYRDHFKSEDHKNRSAEFHYLKALASCSDEDEDAVKPVKVAPKIREEKVDAVAPAKTEIKIKEEKVDAATPAKTEIKVEKEDPPPVEVKKEKPDDDEKETNGEEKEIATKEDNGDKKEKSEKADSAKPKSNDPKASGQLFVVPVQGFYCKLCHKFFKDVVVAKSKHCRSLMHVENFKAAMERALEEEEDRQKLADELEELEQKATEEAELAAEIDAIEQSAKDAAKHEAAKKKSSKKVPKDEDVEMVEVDAEMGEVDADPKNDDSAAPEDKPEENGDVQATPTEDASSDVTPAAAADKPDKSPDESLGPEEDAEEEKEVTVKEEITTSPATRRGRGRGRGRKRR